MFSVDKKIVKLGNMLGEVAAAKIYFDWLSDVLAEPIDLISPEFYNICQQVGAKLIDGRGWCNELSGFQKFLNSLTPLGLVKQLTHRSGMQFAKIQEGILSCIRDNLDLRVEIDAATTKTASLEVKLDAQLSANRRASLEARAASEAAQSLVSFLSSVAPKYVPDPQRHVALLVDTLHKVAAETTDLLNAAINKSLYTPKESMDD